MDHNIKAFAVILLLFFGTSAGSRVKGFRGIAVIPENPSSLQDNVEMEVMRELISVDAMLDYEKPIPNPRHEKGRPGGN